MWPKDYKDYPKDSSLIKEKVDSGKGIIGCEMHESNGWGNSFHNNLKFELIKDSKDTAQRKDS